MRDRQGQLPTTARTARRPPACRHTPRAQFAPGDRPAQQWLPRAESCWRCPKRYGAGCAPPRQSRGNLRHRLVCEYGGRGVRAARLAGVVPLEEPAAVEGIVTDHAEYAQRLADYLDVGNLVILAP